MTAGGGSVPPEQNYLARVHQWLQSLGTEESPVNVKVRLLTNSMPGSFDQPYQWIQIQRSLWTNILGSSTCLCCPSHVPFAAGGSWSDCKGCTHAWRCVQALAVAWCSWCMLRGRAWQQRMQRTACVILWAMMRIWCFSSPG